MFFKRNTKKYSSLQLTFIYCFVLQILRDYFADLLSLAEILLRSPDPAVCSYACAMYKLSFVSFDLYCQQVHQCVVCGRCTYKLAKR